MNKYHSKSSYSGRTDDFQLVYFSCHIKLYKITDCDNNIRKLNSRKNNNTKINCKYTQMY
jgi:hypothetical protein